MGSARLDSIALVEAAYNLEGDLHQWLEGVLKHAAVAFQRGSGVQAIICRGPAEANAEILDMASWGPSEGVEGFFRRSAQSVPAEEQRRLWSHLRGRLASLSECAGWTGVEGFAQDTSHPYCDYLAFLTADAGLDLMMLGLSTQRVESLPIQRRVWSRVGPHLAAGLRLRLRLSGSDRLAREEAVFTPEGRCLHAEGEARTRGNRERLRRLAAHIDRARSLRVRQPEEAAALWPNLAAGRWSLVDRWDSDGRRFVVARYNPPFQQDPRILTKRERQAAELAGRGASNQEIGLELSVSESTAATHVAQALRKLNLRRREELGDALAGGEVSGFCLGADELFVRSAPLPLPSAANAVLTELTEAERAVAVLAAVGKSNQEIATLRNTAVRTVAVQLQNVYRKLAIRSRGELMARLHQ